MSEDGNYPRFLSSKPYGEDWFDGQSQKRLSDAIAEYIRSTDKENNSDHSRIIGIEGGWGVGKSNVIKQLKAELKDSYYTFEYDAWGNQEDLQRRSFLELLTSELISDEVGVLKGETTIKIMGGKPKKATWEEKLKYLLAIKRKTETNKQPRLSSSFVAVILLAAVFLITIHLVPILKECVGGWFSYIPLLPVVGGACLLFNWWRRRDFDINKLGYLFAVYKGTVNNYVLYESISEAEPSVSEFRNWMQDISDSIKNSGNARKIIIVYDNMDRLPAEKVKRLWSSIYTFFSDGGFENIWAVIPFDEKHLACAFGEKESSDRDRLNRYFIDKTFPIIYRVAPPVITDEKKIFDDLFERAFSHSESNDQQLVSRVYRQENPGATVREMIIFINQLVALKSIWKDNVNIVSMAVFIIRRSSILENPVSHILSGLYIGDNLKKVIKDSEELRRDISALVYGISPMDAAQIPMMQYIRSSLRSEPEYDINKYSSSKHFLTILDECIRTLDAPVDDLINGLSKLNQEFESKHRDAIIPLWNHLATNKLDQPFERQEFTDAFGTILVRADKDIREKIVRFLCKAIQDCKKFNGAQYFKALDALANFLKEKEMHVTLTLEDIERGPDDFVDYVIEAEGKYGEYKLSTASEGLDRYFVAMVPDKLENYQALKYLIKDHQFSFGLLLDKIEKTIKNDSQGQTVNKENFKSLLDVYKVISHDKPLKVQLNDHQRINIWNHFASKEGDDGFLDMLIIRSVNNESINIQLSEYQIKYAAENIEYYANYGDLLVKNIRWNNVVLRQILKYMTEEEVDGNLSLSDVLPRFFEITTNIKVDEDVLLKQLSGYEITSDTLNKDNIKVLVPNAQFYKYSTSMQSDFTDFINRVAANALSDVPLNDLYNQRQNMEDYWYQVMNFLLGTVYMKTLPDNLTELVKGIIDDIAKGAQDIPIKDDIFMRLIENVDKRKLSGVITDIRNKFINSTYTINPKIFIFMCEFFKRKGKLLEHASDVVHRIIEPVIDDPSCLEVITSDGLYSDIIIAAKDEATSLKGKVMSKLQGNSNTSFIEFARRIGVTLSNEQEE